MVHPPVIHGTRLRALRHTATRIAASCTVLCALAPAAAADPTPPPRVRSTDSTMLALLREGAERSATFRALLDTIADTNGIVYVEFGVCAFGHLDGCLLPFVASSHGDRYLRVLVTHDRNGRSHDRLLALIAHELRHALEVLDHPDVVDVDTMRAMYQRIGAVPLAGRDGYETAEATAAGDTVLEELLRAQR